MPTQDARTVVREQFERSAELAGRPDDGYTRRWAEFHEMVAEIAVRRLIAEGVPDAEL